MKTMNQTTSSGKYESPYVQMIPLSMESGICKTSNGELETIIITDPYAGDDLG